MDFAERADRTDRAKLLVRLLERGYKASGTDPNAPLTLEIDKWQAEEILRRADRLAELSRNPAVAQAAAAMDAERERRSLCID